MKLTIAIIFILIHSLCPLFEEYWFPYTLCRLLVGGYLGYIAGKISRGDF